MSNAANNIPLTSAALQSYHTPILLNEIIKGLNINPNGIYVDATFGGGGHSKALLKQLNENGKLFVFDQDADAQKNVPQDERVIFIPQNFRLMQRFLRLHKVTKVDGIIADLGVSSHQLDEAERGFSIRFDADLDMRMDRRQTTKASDIIKNFTELQLHKMFEQYGQVTNAKTLAKTIVQQRLIVPINTISEFKNAIRAVVKGNPQKYFAQVFQALRIQVNDELNALKEILTQSQSLLKPGGRMAVITFHSLEDRIVKTFFKTQNFNETETELQNSTDVFGAKPQNKFLIITKKPMLPSAEELKKNTRSRSAKCRIAELI